MKICFISDTHTYHDAVKIPNGIDILVHCGDNTIYGEDWEMRNFITWFGNQKPKHKIFINGNHEMMVWKRSLDKGGITKQMVDNHNKYHMTNIHYLEESGVEIEGLKFWGSPYTPEFFDWAYMYSRNGEGKDIWAKIPEDTDILITHGPPETMLDRVKPVAHYYSPLGGCPYLLEKVAEVKPKIHAFGHIHHEYGTRRPANPKYAETLFVNASTCDGRYVPKHPPIVVDTETWEHVSE